MSSSTGAGQPGPAMAASDVFKKKSKLVGNINVIVGGHILPLTHLDKVYWPESGYTKGDVLRYYYEMAEYVLPYLKNRPLILKRYPDGITKPFFYQHDLKGTPKFLRLESIRGNGGMLAHYAIANDIASLLYVVNMGTIAENPFHSRIGHLARPDYLIFDLDPEAGASFKSVCEVALVIRHLLEELGLKCFAKTSGSTGIHVYVPIKSAYEYSTIVPFTKEIARRAAALRPKIATIERMTHNRKSGQVYIDYLQNSEGKSVASAYSLREKPHAPVSTPLTWKEVAGTIAIEDFTIANIAQRLKKKGDLFAEVLTLKQSIARQLKKVQPW